MIKQTFTKTLLLFTLPMFALGILYLSVKSTENSWGHAKKVIAAMKITMVMTEREEVAYELLHEPM